MTSYATTTIGSFPRFDRDLHRSIDMAVSLQLQSGVDIVSDGEQRTDMVSYFAEFIPGFSIETGIPSISGRINPPDEARNFSKVKDFEYLARKYPRLKIKEAITGPVTLAISCGTRGVGPYRRITDNRLYEDIANALKTLVDELSKRGVWIQIDEPMLSQGLRDYPEKLRFIDGLMSDIPYEKASIHVCGYLGRHGVVDHLLKLDNVSTLSHAFSSGQERLNSRCIERKKFADAGKKLGIGCISVTAQGKEEIDRPVDVAGRIQEIVDIIGMDQAGYLHPDCGMRATDPFLVPLIMESFSQGIKLFKKSSTEGL